MKEGKIKEKPIYGNGTKKEIEELKQNSHAPKTIEEIEGYEDLINRIKELENK